MGEELILNNEDGQPILLTSSMDMSLGGRILTSRRFALPAENLAIHNCVRLGLTVPMIPGELILTREEGGYGFQETYLHLNPTVGRMLLQSTHGSIYGFGNITCSGPEHDILGMNYFNTAERMINQGNYKVHLFPNGIMGLESRVD